MYFFQLRIGVRDDHQLVRSDEADVIIRVTRSLSAPDFQGQPYEAEVSETAEVGASVFTLVARDRDIQGDIKYELVGDYLALYFFTVDRDSGDVTVASDLLQDKAFEYSLHVVAYDDVFPSQRTTATVEVSVLRNEQRPRWTHENPLRVSISELLPLGAVVTDTPNAEDADENVTYGFTLLFYFVDDVTCFCVSLI